MNNTISVIIPTFNRADYLIEAINSVFNQTYPINELIIIDDCSTDNTEPSINSFLLINKNVRYIKNATNKGVSFSRNRGIKLAKSEFIAFLDSDDLWHPEKMKKQIESFQQNPNQIICHTNEKWLMNGNHKNQSSFHKKQGGFFFERCLERCLVSPSSVMIKREIFDQVGLFDENLTVCEDYDLWIRLQLKIPFEFLDEELVVKRGGHADQLSKSSHSMDVFRIKSLIKLVGNSEINETQKKLVFAVIEKKNVILRKGAIKHLNKSILKFTDMVYTFISDHS